MSEGSNVMITLCAMVVMVMHMLVTMMTNDDDDLVV